MNYRRRRQLMTAFAVLAAIAFAAKFYKVGREVIAAYFAVMAA